MCISRNRERANSLCTQIMVLSIAISVAMTVIMFFAQTPLLDFISGGDDTELGKQYVMPFIICSYPVIMNGIMIGLLRSEGAAKRSMMLSVMAALITIVLDPILIYGLDLGLMGAAFATVISYIAVTAIGFYWYLGGIMYVRPSFKGFRFVREQISDILTVGAPNSFQLLIVPLLMIPENALVYACGGDAGMIAYHYSFYFVTLACIPSTAIAAAMIPITSAAQGQNDFEKAKLGFRYSAKLAMGISLMIGIVLFIFAGPLTSMYAQSPEIAPMHTEMTKALMIYAFVTVVISRNGICSAIQQSLRFAHYAMTISVFREILFLSFYWAASGISMDAIYWSVNCVNVITLAVNLIVTVRSVRTREKAYPPPAAAV